MSELVAVAVIVLQGCPVAGLVTAGALLVAGAAGAVLRMLEGR